MDSQQHGVQEDATCIVDSNCGCNIGDEGNDDNTANTIGNSMNVDNIETEGTSTISSIVKAWHWCVTSEDSEQNQWYGFSHWIKL